MITIDSYFHSAMSKIKAESVLLWVIFAVAVWMITVILYRRGHIKKSTTVIIIPLLVLYMCFTLTITVVERYARETSRYKLELFWSYRAILQGRTDLIVENFWNVILFIPLGCLLAGLLQKKLGRVVIIGSLVSAMIELYQLISNKGLFEFDDIIHNTIGTLIGVIVYMLIWKCLCTIIPK